MSCRRYQRKGGVDVLGGGHKCIAMATAEMEVFLQHR